MQGEQKQQSARRIGRVARVASVATKTGATSKKRRIVAYKRRVSAGLRTIHQNQYRLVAGAFVILLGLSTALAPFIQATTEKPIMLNGGVTSLVGAVRDDAKDYLKSDANKQP